MDQFIEFVGFAAAFCTTVAFVPQVLKTWKSRSAKDLSLGMFSIFSTGIALWLAYGLFTTNWPIILANAVTLVLALTLLVFKFTLKE